MYIVSVCVCAYLIISIIEVCKVDIGQHIVITIIIILIITITSVSEFELVCAIVVVGEALAFA